MMNKFDIYKKQIRNNKFYHLLFGRKKLAMKYYKKIHGYSYDINNPVTFTEKVNSRKISNEKLLPICTDKIKVRDYVSKKIGKKYLIPKVLVCKKLTKDIYRKLPNQCVIKTANGSGSIKVIKNKLEENENEVIQLFEQYQKVDFAFIWGEMHYRKIPNTIIVEKLLIDKTGKIPDDYKIHCFNNNGDKKFFIQVEADRFGNHSRNIYDTNWNLLDIKTGLDNSEYIIKRPKNLKEMLKVADKLSEDFKYVRVDLYTFNNRIYFGELTFTPAAGFSKFNKQEYNKLWGNYWR